MNCRVSLGEQRAGLSLGALLRPGPVSVGAAGDGNKIQPRPLRFPLPDVAPAEPGLDQVIALGILGDKAFPGDLVDDEGLVQAGQDAPIESSFHILAERFAGLSELLHQCQDIRAAPGSSLSGLSAAIGY